jgi:hypothetical protein
LLRAAVTRGRDFGLESTRSNASALRTARHRVVLLSSEYRRHSGSRKPKRGTEGAYQEGRVLRNILIIVYLVIGVVVARSNHYFSDLNSLTSVLSALLAVLLWPLILFGVSLHIK